MGQNIECPNPSCRKLYVVIDTTAFRCSACGAEIDVQFASRLHAQRIAQEKMAALRRERLRQAKYLLIALALGVVLHGLGRVGVVFLCIAAAWLFLNRLRSSSWIPISKILTAVLLLFVLGSIFGDYFSPPTALCRDMTYSYSANDSGTCSWHGGVDEWDPGPWWSRL